MRESIIRIGVLSTADIGLRSVIPAILQLPSKFKLIGIASRSMEKACSIAKKYHIKPFGSYDELLDNDLIDAVYVPLPNALHFSWVHKALERNIHVLVEKSMGCCPEEVIELNHLAKKKSLALIENFQFRFHPQLSVIKNKIKAGIIGDVRHIRSSFEFPAFPDKLNIRYQKELGGGALLDAGAYPIKISQLFMGLDISVKGAVQKYEDLYEVDIGGGAIIRQENGNVFSEISFGFNNFYQCSIEIFGVKGKISTNRIFTAPVHYSPIIKIELIQAETIMEKVKPDNAFVNMLEYFYLSTRDSVLRESEYKQNMNQSRLINEFNLLANAR